MAKRQKDKQDIELQILKEHMATTLRYLNQWRDVLPKINDEIIALKLELTTIRSSHPTGEIKGKGENPNGYDHRIVVVLDKLKHLNQKYITSSENIESIDYALTLLSYEKRIILTSCYIQKPVGYRMSEVVRDLAVNMHFDESTIYNKRNEALIDLVAIIHGYMPRDYTEGAVIKC